MKRLVHVTSKKTLPTYSRLRAVSWYALKLAHEHISGQLHHCMTAMLFSAFCLEAYLNHLGDQHIDLWKSKERTLSPYKKLQVISTALGFEPDLTVMPYQTFKSIFTLRALLVHGKTETLILEDDLILSPDENPPEPLSEWEKFISLKSAELFVKDTKAMIIDLGSHAGIEESDVFEKETVDVKIEEKVDAIIAKTVEKKITYLDDERSPSS
jgi:hypothetical protein